LLKKSRLNKRGTILILIWVFLLVLSLSLLSILASIFAHNPQEQSITTLSWAGYGVLKNSNPNFEVIAINASWVVPEVNASQGDGSSSAWIGIGGQGDGTLIQAGTEQDAANGQGTYYAWYELLPAFTVRLNDVVVSPGNIMVVSINLVNSDRNLWEIQVTDETTGQAFSRDVVYNSTRSSGEWILERPAVSNKISTLADFGSIAFKSCYVNVSNADGPIAEFSFSKIQMSNSQEVPLTSTSDLTDGKSSFTVSYRVAK
jgi:flagellar basal body-associated protein FliL